MRTQLRRRVEDLGCGFGNLTKGSEERTALGIDEKAIHNCSHGVASKAKASLLNGIQRHRLAMGPHVLDAGDGTLWLEAFMQRRSGSPMIACRAVTNDTRK